MMAYSSNCVAVITDASGKPFREMNQNGERVVHVPFGCEYKIRLTNKNYHRSLVKVSIDGMDATNAGLILPNFGSVDLERFLSGNKKFRFVSVQGNEHEITDPTSPQNGVVEVQFFRESYEVVFAQSQPSGWHPRGIMRGVEKDLAGATVSCCCCNSVNTSYTLNSSQQGATVEGSHSNQQFAQGHGKFEDYPFATLRIKMVGSNPGAWVNGTLCTFSVDGSVYNEARIVGQNGNVITIQLS
jgi:hypothetical protein